MELKSQANQGTVTHDVYWDQFLLMRGVNDPQQRKEFSTRIINYSNDILPIPGAREALLKMKERGFLLGIITDTMYPVEWKMRRLEKAGVAEFIDIVACSTDLGHTNQIQQYTLMQFSKQNCHKKNQPSLVISA